MSIWPILILGGVSAFFAWRRDSMQRLFDSSRQKSNGLTNKEELMRSLDALIDFLCKHEQLKWVKILQDIRTHLNKKSTEALSQLSDVFGGMNSLNDIVFDGAGVDQEYGRLLDAVFRDMKLYYGTTEHRVEWRKLEEEHKDELPPRIRHAFRKE